MVWLFFTMYHVVRTRMMLADMQVTVSRPYRREYLVVFPKCLLMCFSLRYSCVASDDSATAKRMSMQIIAFMICVFCLLLCLYETKSGKTDWTYRN